MPTRGPTAAPTRSPTAPTSAPTRLDYALDPFNGAAKHGLLVEDNDELQRHVPNEIYLLVPVAMPLGITLFFALPVALWSLARWQVRLGPALNPPPRLLARRCTVAFAKWAKRSGTQRVTMSWLSADILAAAVLLPDILLAVAVSTHYGIAVLHRGFDNVLAACDWQAFTLGMYTFVQPATLAVVAVCTARAFLAEDGMLPSVFYIAPCLVATWIAAFWIALLPVMWTGFYIFPSERFCTLDTEWYNGGQLHAVLFLTLFCVSAAAVWCANAAAAVGWLLRMLNVQVQRKSCCTKAFWIDDNNDGGDASAGGDDDNPFRAVRGTERTARRRATAAAQPQSHHAPPRWAQVLLGVGREAENVEGEEDDDENDYANAGRHQVFLLASFVLLPALFTLTWLPLAIITLSSTIPNADPRPNGGAAYTSHMLIVLAQTAVNPVLYCVWWRRAITNPFFTGAPLARAPLTASQKRALLHETGLSVRETEMTMRNAHQHDLRETNKGARELERVGSTRSIQLDLRDRAMMKERDRRGAELGALRENVERVRTSILVEANDSMRAQMSKKRTLDTLDERLKLAIGNCISLGVGLPRAPDRAAGGTASDDSDSDLESDDSESESDDDEATDVSAVHDLEEALSRIEV